MKTILVPVDFSRTSDHAAKYALRLAQQLTDCRLILLYALRTGYYETILPSADYTQYGEEEVKILKHSFNKQLIALKDRLNSICQQNVPIDVLILEGRLASVINEVNKKEHPRLVVIGSNGSDENDDRKLGENTIMISKTSTCPVLVVPPRAVYKPVEKVLLACDFKKVNRIMPAESLKDFISLFGAKLEVLNVSPREEQLKEEMEEERGVLDEILKGMEPTYHFTHNKNVAEGILNFAKNSHAQIIVSLPRQYSFFQSILHTSISTSLAFKSDKPVLLLRKD